MKALLAATFLIASFSSYCQADSLYIVTYTTGPAWSNSKQPGEQTHFKEHSANLGKLRKEGVIKFGARYAEKGIIIISASNRTAAQEMIFADPGVANGLFNADLQKLSPFYWGCIEKPGGTKP